MHPFYLPKLSTVNPLQVEIVSTLDRLAQKWQQCFTDRFSTCDLDRRVFNILVAAYTQPDRHYHNLNHIDRLLTTIDRTESLQNPTAVRLAVWFHDFVYDSQASDNEAQSAKSAEELLTNIGISSELIDRVQQLILATQGHQIDPDDPDRCIFLDADLAILGADPVEYQAYMRSIRREYSWASDAAYKVGRIQVLESFLQRDRLYYSDILGDELESIARLNLKQEIANYQN